MHKSFGGNIQNKRVVSAPVLCTDVRHTQQRKEFCINYCLKKYDMFLSI